MAGSNSTTVSMRAETAVVLASDIRNHTGMSEVLPNREFSTLISNWFRESTDIIERNGGTIDKFIGDAVLAYWVAGDRARLGREVQGALTAALEMITRAERFSERLGREFAGHTFRIGVGVNLGEVIMGNVGTGEVQSFTIVGDSVNVAFRLESLTREKGVPVITSRAVAELASSPFDLRDLGMTEVEGRKEPVSTWGMGWKETSSGGL